MKTILLAVLIAGVACAAPAQPKPARVSMWGDAVRLGQSLLADGQTAEALASFRQAAAGGDVDGSLAAGRLLVDLATRAEGMSRIQQSREGLGYLFFAATNRNAAACVELSRACILGLGLKADGANAYAWLKLAAEFNPAYKSALDQLVIRLEPACIPRAQALAQQWLDGYWPVDDFCPVELGDPRLKVQGRSICANGRQYVVLNGSTFAPAETGQVVPVNGARNLKTPRLTVTCLEIGTDYVLVRVAGDRCLRLLPSDPT